MKTSRNTNENTAPVHTARAGTVRASVWESQNEQGQSQYKISISRFFRQGDAWQRAHTFYAEQLAAVVEAVSSAQRWIDQRRRQKLNPNPQRA